MEKTVLEPIDDTLKVGDKVYCNTEKKNGTVNEIDNTVTYPISVVFDGIFSDEIYTKDGRLFEDEPISLFKGHYKDVETLIIGEKIAD